MTTAELLLPNAAPDAVPAPRVSAVVARPHPAGGWAVSVIGKRTYRVARNHCVDADEQLALVEAPCFSEDAAVLLHDTDLLVNRTQVDVIVLGHAYPPATGAAVTGFDAVVRAGDLVRTIRAMGPRRCWVDSGGRRRFTQPTPLDRIPLDWSSCYGGLDAASFAAHGDPFGALAAEVTGVPHDPRFGPHAYPRNPVGRGYLIEPTPAALEQCALPLLEEPLRLLTPETHALGEFVRWPAAPPVAALGWLSYNYFPRLCQLGLPPVPYDDAAYPPERFFEVRLGAAQPASIRFDATLPARLDLRAAQCAALGMRTPRLEPGAAVELLNLHPREPAWRFHVPPAPQVALRMPGADAAYLTPALRTVVLEPDLDRVTLLWVAEQRESLPVGPNKAALIQHAFAWAPAR